MEGRVQQVLEECLELLRQGVSLEQCLARYPECAQELEPLLRTALTAQGQLTPGMPSAARTRIQARVLAEWDRRHLPRQRRWGLPFFLPRWAAVAASVVLAIVLGGVGTVAAAGSSSPAWTLTCNSYQPPAAAVTSPVYSPVSSVAVRAVQSVVVPL